MKCQSQTKNRTGNRVDPDETVRYEPSHLDLRCLQKCLFGSVGLKGLIKFYVQFFVLRILCLKGT